jgi:osmotically inducible protein OsmC
LVTGAARGSVKILYEIYGNGGEWILAMVDREAHVVWQGNLANGSGNLSEGSGVLSNTPVTFASRVERPDGKTSPEELIASAHATCYAMALSNVLTEHDAQPERLEVDAVCTLDDQQLKITNVNLDVRGTVPGYRRGRVRERRTRGRAALPRLERPEGQRGDPAANPPGELGGKLTGRAPPGGSPV